MSDAIVVNILPPEKVGVLSGGQGALDVTIAPAQQIVVQSRGNTVSRPADTIINITPSVSVDVEARAPFPIGVPGAGEAGIIVNDGGAPGPAGAPGRDGEPAYGVTIESTNGDFFRPGVGSTVLIPHIFRGAEEVTDTIPTVMFKWSRVSDNPALDDLWNSQHAGAYRSIVLTPADRRGRATFSLKIE